MRIENRIWLWMSATALLLSVPSSFAVSKETEPFLSVQTEVFLLSDYKKKSRKTKR